jgi:cbb3-type cytochrome c oxidase subunit III
MNRDSIFLAIITATLLASTSAFGAEDAEIKELTTKVCANCHGSEGFSNSSAFPHLAGQSAAYTEMQLKAFKDKTRADRYAVAYMWGMASQLDEGTIKRIAAYYADMRPVSRPGRTTDNVNVVMGKEIFDKGLPDAGVMACGSCHGDDAQGKDANPRLAGQHSEYLLKQLVAYKSLKRGNASVMSAVVANMTPEQMRAVAEYVAAQ